MTEIEPLEPPVGLEPLVDQSVVVGARQRRCVAPVGVDGSPNIRLATRDHRVVEFERVQVPLGSQAEFRTWRAVGRNRVLVGGVDGTRPVPFG